MTAEFKRNRLPVLERDHWLCQLRYKGICLRDATEVDHKKNRDSGGTDGMENLQAVCSKCHARKTHFESRRAIARRKKDLKHPWTQRKAPGLR